MPCTARLYGGRGVLDRLPCPAPRVFRREDYGEWSFIPAVGAYRTPASPYGTARRLLRRLIARDQRDHTERRVVEVVALLEANAVALIQNEHGARRGIESGGRVAHCVAQIEHQMQVHAALECHGAGNAFGIE